MHIYGRWVVEIQRIEGFVHLGDASASAILCHQIMDLSFAVWQTVTQIRHRALTTMQQDQCEKLGVSGKEVENMQHVLATQNVPRGFPYGTGMPCKSWARQRLSAVEGNREDHCWNAFATSRPFTSWTWLARSQYPRDTQDFWCRQTGFSWV